MTALAQYQLVHGVKCVYKTRLGLTRFFLRLPILFLRFLLTPDNARDTSTECLDLVYYAMQQHTLSVSLGHSTVLTLVPVFNKHTDTENVGKGQIQLQPDEFLESAEVNTEVLIAPFKTSPPAGLGAPKNRSFPRYC